MDPKFYPNSDNSHCLQCCIRMILNSILPKEEYSDLMVEEGSEYDSKLWTWTIAGAMMLSKELGNMDIIMKSSFDYNRFAEEGSNYCKQVWSLDWLSSQEKHASKGFKKERKLASKFLNSGGRVVPFNSMNKAQEEIKELVKHNFVIAQVDHRRLYNIASPCSSIHYILLFAEEGGVIMIHDPGLPQKRSCPTKWDNFMDAFSFELISVPKPKWWNEKKIVGRKAPCPCGSGKINRKCHNLTTINTKRCLND